MLKPVPSGFALSIRTYLPQKDGQLGRLAKKRSETLGYFEKIIDKSSILIYGINQ